MLLTLSNGGSAIIDDDVLETPFTLEVREGEFYTFRICDSKWRHKDHERLPYVQTVVNRGGRLCCVRLHRLIMQAPRGLVVDHINRDVLDNRKSNLRVVDHSVNNRNRAKQKRRNGIYTNPLTGERVLRFEERQRQALQATIQSVTRA